jgi:hypothetical protein
MVSSKLQREWMQITNLNPSALANINRASVIANVIVKLHDPHERVPGDWQSRITERGGKVFQHSVEDKRRPG